MAFTARAERQIKLNNVLETPTAVGPGSYDNSYKHVIDTAHAPFGSTAARQIGSPGGVVTPGPGTYRVDQALSAIPKAEKAKQLITTKSPRKMFYENKEAISKPGPGTYDLPSSIKVSKPANHPAFKQPSIGWERVQTAPSIPIKDQCFGYEEGDRGALVRQPNPNRGFDGVKETVGPGVYDVNSAYVNTRPSTTAGNVSFSKSKVSRIAFGSPAEFANKNASPGPGQYDWGLALQGPPTLQKPSSSFASRVQRTPAGVSKVKEELPGPAIYDSHLYHAIKTKDVPAAMQCFGSTSVRKTGTFEKKTETPGPGTYHNATSRSLRHRRQDANKPGFAATAQRWNEKDHKTQAPGPGAYDEDNRQNWVSKLARQQISRVACFGSTTERFAKKSKNSKPTPEDVIMQSASVGSGQAEQTARSSRVSTPAAVRRGPTSSFSSRVTRFDRPRRDDGMPAPGTYKPKDEWVRKKGPGKVVPFGSSGQRHSVENNAKGPGPGQYVSELDSLAWKIAMKPERMSGNMMGTTARFGSLGQPSAAPGPGSYNASHPDYKLVKKSFNVTVSAEF